MSELRGDAGCAGAALLQGTLCSAGLLAPSCCACVATAAFSDHSHQAFCMLSFLLIEISEGWFDQRSKVESVLTVIRKLFQNYSNVI